MRRREIIGGLGGLGLAAPSLALGAPQKAVLGSVAPDFSVLTFDHEVAKLSEMKGDVVVLNYWATWCGPCQAELPAMDQVMRESAGRGLRIYAVLSDSNWDRRAVQRVADKLSFPVGRKLIGKGYGTIDKAVPTSFVIDRKGVIRHAKAGSFTYTSFSDLVNPLLDEPRPVEVA